MTVRADAAIALTSGISQPSGVAAAAGGATPGSGILSTEELITVEQ